MVLIEMSFALLDHMNTKITGTINLTIDENGYCQENYNVIATMWQIIGNV